MDRDTAGCTGGQCGRGVWVEQASVAEEAAVAAGATTSEIALYVGLSLAVVVFLVVLLVALSLLRRRRLPSGYRLTQSGERTTTTATDVTCYVSKHRPQLTALSYQPQYYYLILKQNCQT